jgi:hypothetical protein
MRATVTFIVCVLVVVACAPQDEQPAGAASPERKLRIAEVELPKRNPAAFTGGDDQRGD